MFNPEFWGADSGLFSVSQILAVHPPCDHTITLSGGFACLLLCFLVCIYWHYSCNICFIFNWFYLKLIKRNHCICHPVPGAYINGFRIFPDHWYRRKTAKRGLPVYLRTAFYHLHWDCSALRKRYQQRRLSKIINIFGATTCDASSNGWNSRRSGCVCSPLLTLGSVQGVTDCLKARRGMLPTSLHANTLVSWTPRILQYLHPSRRPLWPRRRCLERVPFQTIRSPSPHKVATNWCWVINCIYEISVVLWYKRLHKIIPVNMRSTWKWN